MRPTKSCARRSPNSIEPPLRRTNPKRPGRKPGMGLFSYRRPPSPDEITEPPVDVPVTADTCPGCGGRLQHEVGLAYLTDIRPIPQPTVTKYRIQVCRCTVCGKQVRAHHPDVAPDQWGASAHRVGRRAMATDVLHYGVGVPAKSLECSTGLELTQGAITQDAMRRARGAVGTADCAVRDRPSVHTDDIEWAASLPF